MKCKWKSIFVILFSLFLTHALCSPSPALAAKKAKPAAAANYVFDVNKMADMSDFDPASATTPSGDTIKIAVVASFSGPAALNGQLYWAVTQWVAHDINKRGGIFVDGKKKMIQLFKADHMSKADQCKKICERMILQEKVQFLWGTDGSNMMKIMNETANKYKVVVINTAGLSDDLQDATNFTRYSFMTAMQVDQLGRGMAYYYGQIRKKEKKFYILCQDYSYGHGVADGFKHGLKEFFTEGQIVGEDYHKLFLTDYAPYLTKIRASGAEVIWTGDWLPDSGNLLKQARQLGVKIPFANVYIDEPNFLHEVGVEGTAGLVNIDHFDSAPPYFRSPGHIKYYKMWNGQWRKWKTAPFNSRLFEHGSSNIGGWIMQTYWFLSILERVKTTDPEKIIQAWEGDSFQTVNGRIWKMRACDHKCIRDFSVTEYARPKDQKISFNMPPYYWFQGASFNGPGYDIPAAKVLPLMDANLDRCKGKNGWGE